MAQIAIYVTSTGSTTASGYFNIYNSGPSMGATAYGHIFKDLYTRAASGSAAINQLSQPTWSLTGLSPGTTYDLDAYMTTTSSTPSMFFDSPSDAIFATSVSFTTTAAAPTWYDNTITTSGRVGYYYSSSIGANDATSYSWSGLPSGITASGRTISGVPNFSGNYNVSFSATGAGGTIYGSATISVAIPYPTWTDQVVSTTMRQGDYYSDGVSASDVSYYSSSGSIPPGLNFNTSNGSFTGTPTTPGSYTFAFQAFNANGEGVGTSNISATVKYPLASWTDESISQLELSVGQSYSDSVLASNASYYSLVGTLPDGISLNTSTGAISGTASAAGNFSFSIRAYNGSSEYISTASFSISVIDVGGRAFIYDGAQWIERDVYTYTGSWNTRGTVYYYDGVQWQKSLET